MDQTTQPQAAETPAAKAGVKEVSELLTGLLEAGLAFTAVSKDGLDPMKDAAAVIAKYQNDAAFRSKIDEAFKGVSSVPAEVKDLDAAEIAQLIGIVIQYVPKYLEALK